jgi:hypothetical protein
MWTRGSYVVSQYSAVLNTVIKEIVLLGPGFSMSLHFTYGNIINPVLASGPLYLLSGLVSEFAYCFVRFILQSLCLAIKWEEG